VIILAGGGILLNLLIQKADGIGRKNIQRGSGTLPSVLAEKASDACRFPPAALSIQSAASISLAAGASEFEERRTDATLQRS